MPDGMTTPENYSQFRIGKPADLPGGGVQTPESSNFIKSIKPDEGHELRIGNKVENRGRLFGDNEGEDGERKMSPEEREFLRKQYEGVAEKIKNADTQEERKFWTVWTLGRIIDYNDDWSARLLRETIALKVADGGDVLKSLLGEYDPTETEDPQQAGLEQSLNLIQDLDKVFDQWFANYKALAPSGMIFKTAFSQIPEYMPPELFKRIYGEIPGLKDNESGEWPTISEQVDKALRANIYLALQSDPRWKNELQWFKEGRGFKKLFPNETSEKDWLRRLKLATLPNEKDDVADLYGKSYDSLSDVEKARLDKIPAHNRFADTANGGTVKAIRTAIKSLVSEGINQNDKAMQFQAGFAEDLAEKTFRYFGLASMYSTRATKWEIGGKKSKDWDSNVVATEVAAEAYPWSDAGLDLMRPRDKNRYNIQSDYWTGPSVWVNHAPEHLMVDFMKMLSIRDTRYPESKGATKSAWEEFRDGKTLGKIFENEDHVADWSYRAYLIRFLFGYREDSGALQFMSGALVTGKYDLINQAKYWDDGEKSIHILARDWIVTNGKYKEWFDNHRSEIDVKMREIVKENRDLSDDALRRKAENALLKIYVKRTKNRWKGIAFLSAYEQIKEHSVRQLGMREAALQIKYLDPRLIARKINFDNPREIEKFLDDAENSTD